MKPVDTRPNAAVESLSMYETTPTEVTSDVADFCSQLSGEAPVFVDVAATPSARAGWCFANVANLVADKGGRPLEGWIIWLASGLWLCAEFHVVWNVEGRLLDVTPKVDDERSVLFLPDPRGPDFDFFQRPANVRMRVYGHEQRRAAVVAKIASFSEARLSLETIKAKQNGLTLLQSVGATIKRDRFERLIDDFLEEVGSIDAMLVPTPAGMVCRNPRREGEFTRRVRETERRKTNLLRMVAAIEMSRSSLDTRKD